MFALLSRCKTKEPKLTMIWELQYALITGLPAPDTEGYTMQIHNWYFTSEAHAKRFAELRATEPLRWKTSKIPGCYKVQQNSQKVNGEHMYFLESAPLIA
jgi:hypothetical protein